MRLGRAQSFDTELHSIARWGNSGESSVVLCWQFGDGGETGDEAHFVSAQDEKADPDNGAAPISFFSRDCGRYRPRHEDQGLC